MNSHVEVISKEMIKPSSQTPQHPKTHELSLFDQLMPQIFVPVIFFYEADESKGLITSNHVEISQHLKKSLSETLTSFCPLAGRIRDNLSVDCNDAGVEFINARVHARLMDSIKEPDVEVLKNYLPLDPITMGCPGEGPLFLMQINFFECGGIALGICVAHQIADGLSIMKFVKAWAATNRGEPEISQLIFNLSSFFPAREFPGFKTWMTDNNIGAKRFVFDKEKLSVLRQAAISPSESTVNDPTRVELVSAFISKHLLEYNSKQRQKVTAAFHAVNLRARMGPDHGILENVFGNFVAIAIAFPDSVGAGTSDQHDGVEEFHDLVRKFRTSIRSINADAMTKVLTGDSSRIQEVMNLFMNEKLEVYRFTSWCGFPVYDVDFKWGKPIWMCTPRWPTKNSTILLKSRNGEDIEAWVNMDQDILEFLETQIKLI